MIWLGMQQRMASCLMEAYVEAVIADTVTQISS